MNPANPFLACTTRRKRLQSIGVSVTETTPEMRMAAVIVTANSRKSRPRMPPMNRIGMNTAASETVIVTNREADLLRALQRRLERRLARFHVAHGVLEHHDRVVHDEADGEDQRHHRQVVEAVVHHAS